MSEAVTSIDKVVPINSEATPGLSHLFIVTLIDKTGLPAWQISVTNFLTLVIIGEFMLVLNRVPDPGMYSNVIAFVAIISFFLLFYLEMGRGWQRDLISILTFDSAMARALPLLEPTRLIVYFELVLAFISAMFNVVITRGLGGNDDYLFVGFVALYYFLEFLFIILSLDIFVRQMIVLMKITRSIRIDLMQSDFYSTLGNSMLRFLKLYIFGLCVITFSYNIFGEGKLSVNEMFIAMAPYYLPGFFMLGAYLIPYNAFKRRMRTAKSIEHNHIVRALNGDREHLEASLVSDDADRLTKVDLLYYEERIKNIKEWPFTDRIRSMIFFGVLPPLTWVIAALVEMLLESLI